MEMINPGFSIKPEDHLGEPGSEQRNPYIAAIFHETKLAKTKGSGIRTMRKLMEQAGLVPPTYASNHSSNEFTTRLLLHHFLSENDLKWLDKACSCPNACWPTCAHTSSTSKSYLVISKLVV